MNQLSIFSGPYALLARWAVLCIACAALYGAGWVKGHHSAELDFEAFKGGVEAVGKEAIAREVTKEKRQNETIKTAVSERDAALRRLRDAGSGSRKLSAAPAAANGSGEVCIGAERYNAAMAEARNEFQRFLDKAKQLSRSGAEAQIDAQALLKAWPK